MTDGLADRYATLLTRYSRYVLVVLVVATLVVGSGATNVDSGLTVAQFGSDSTAAQKLDYVRANFSAGERNVTSMQVVVRGGNTLSKPSLVETLQVQRALRANETVAPTLRARQPTVGLANLVAVAAMRGGGSNATGPNATASTKSANATAPGTAGQSGGESAAGLPSLERQVAQLQSMQPAEVERVVARVLDPDRAATGPVDPYRLLPTGYEPGSTTASARVLFVFQDTGTSDSELPQRVVDAQLATRAIADEQVASGETFVFGAGIVDAEATAATGESFAIITPVALAVILTVLFVAYRDVVDVVLALVGAALVLVWMAGFMGWAGIGVTQILIAVPFLLLGLAIDYALHVVMRYREARTEDPDRSPREGIRVGLAGVTAALAATTFTTAVGFLSNVVSPIDSIAEFGVVAAAGIVSAFLVFAVLLPTVKLEVDGLLERFGFDRRKRAFGTAGVANRVLGVGSAAARRLPVAVVVVALLVSAGGGVAATDIDTSIDQVDFLPRDSPEWMESLPGPFAPSDYAIRENAIFLNENFVQSSDRATAEILVEGSVTDDDTLERVAAGRRAIGNSSTAVVLASGQPSVEGPVSVLESVAAENETVAAVVDGADTDGNGVPDRNLRAVYDALYGAAPERAADVVYREDGTYRALRLSVAVRGGADSGAVTTEMRDVATVVEADSDLRVTATGQPVVTELVQRGLLRTLVETFLITLGVILAFLSVAFYRRYGTATLGAVTMVPVVFALGWILGTMYLLGIPFNTETAVIASIAIGLGVDYAIHVSERFVEELGRGDGATDALERTVSGTGGALLASAVTTASGFGVLWFALVPSLRRFGLVTGTTILYAFLASVVVLPSLLVLWYRYVDDATVGHSNAAAPADSEERPADPEERPADG